jgi:hypothetical protein
MEKMTRATDMPCYQIHVQGVLDPQWSNCLGGLDISVREQPAQPRVTVLTGPLADQAALQGVLDTLFMLNMPLLLVERCPQRVSWAEPRGMTGADSSTGPVSTARAENPSARLVLEEPTGGLP